MNSYCVRPNGYMFLSLLIVALFAVWASTLSGAWAAPAEEDLLLTPFIQSGELEEAKKLAENNWKSLGASEIKSYSGYFTLDDDSHLFSWFFPSQQNPEKAPVILWVNEIPGWSLIPGVMSQTGPFLLDEHEKLVPRNSSWTKTHSLLYIDTPAGTGFSFSSKEDVSLNDVEGDEVYLALLQFFTLFPEFQKQELYLAGENYAASFIPYIVKHIESGNKKDGTIHVNLKGFLIGSPFLDVEQFRRAKSLYHLGLLDEEERKQMDAVADQAIQLVNEGKYLQGAQLALSTYIGPDSIMAKFTGFENVRSALKSRIGPEPDRVAKFIVKPEVRKFLHAGSQEFKAENEMIFAHFAKEMAASHSDIYQEILNSEYRVLFYVPQFDTLNVWEKTDEVVGKLSWNGQEEFNNAPRHIWKVEDEVAGYVKVTKGFTYVLVRNAGNDAIVDQPQWVFDMVEKFLYNKPFF